MNDGLWPFDLPSEEFLWAMEVLAKGGPLNEDDSARVFTAIYGVLCDPEPELLWETAWDALHLFGKNHTSLVPYLCQAVTQESGDETRARHARVWAIRALGRIGGPVAIEFLTGLKGQFRPRSFTLHSGLDKEIKRALHRCMPRR